MMIIMDGNLDGYEVVDAEGMVLGRLATAVAKMLIEGKKVALINAEKAIITGNKNTIVARYNVRRNLQNKANPEHSPHWPRRPDLLVKRIIRGMLPYRKPKGKSAYSRLRVFINVPEGLKNVKPITVNVKSLDDVFSKYITVEEVSRLLGYTK